MIENLSGKNLIFTYQSLKAVKKKVILDLALLLFAINGYE